MSTLKNLDVSTKSWDPILCFLIRRKLDQKFLAALENSADALTEILTLRCVLTFNERRACKVNKVIKGEIFIQARVERIDLLWAHRDARKIFTS